MKNNLMLLIAVFSFCFQAIAQDYNQSAIVDSINNYLEKNHIPGMFVSIIKDNQVFLQDGFGFANREENTPTNEEHLFRIGSISKTFTALAILKLAEEGKINLDASLKNIAPEIAFHNPFEDKYEISIKDLLGHRAGFDDMHLSAFTHSRPSDMTALEEVMVYEKSLTSRWEPGLVHSYSNPCYTILGYLVEKVSGQTYQSYILDNIIYPLGMTHTHFSSQTSHDFTHTELAIGYEGEEDKLTKASNTPLIGEAAGAILSNAKDMSKLLMFFLDQKLQDSLNIVSSSSVNMMEQFHGINDHENMLQDGYGLGLFTNEYGSKDFQFWGHNGGINGFLSNMIYSEELNLAIALSANLPSGNRALITQIVDHFTSNYEKTLTSYESEKVHNYSDWEGTYEVLTTRNEIFRIMNYPFSTSKLSIEGDSLYLQNFLSNKNAFHPQAGSSFSAEKNAIASLHLSEFEEENVLFYNGNLLKKTSSTKYLVIRVILALSFITGLLCLLFSILLLISKIFKKGNWKTIKEFIIYALPVISFGLMVLFFLSNMGGLFVFSILSCIHFYINKNKYKSLITKGFYATTCLSSLFLTLYCMKFGWIGLALWIV